MDNSFLLGIFVAIFLILILYFVRKWRISRANTILLIGLSDSGKTLLFSQLITGHPFRTYTSMKENEYPNFLIKNGRKKIHLVDIPGADRLRPRLLSNWFDSARNSILAIIFVIDSLSFLKFEKDVAQLLHDVICFAPKKPLLIACNKQDLKSAEDARTIKNSLERELNILNQTRNASLDSTDEKDDSKKTLNIRGKRFRWTDFGDSVEFVECSISDFTVINRWMDSL